MAAQAETVVQMLNVCVSHRMRQTRIRRQEDSYSGSKPGMHPGRERGGGDADIRSVKKPEPEIKAWLLCRPGTRGKQSGGGEGRERRRRAATQRSVLIVRTV